MVFHSNLSVLKTCGNKKEKKEKKKQIVRFGLLVEM